MVQNISEENMGGGESKPHFPTENQWQTYRADRIAAVDSVREDLESVQKTITEEENQLEHKLLLGMVNYMRECQDRALIKRVFTDNPGCTQAKKDIMNTGALMLANMDKSSQLQNMKKNMRNKL